MLGEEGQGVLDSQDSWDQVLDSLPDDGQSVRVCVRMYLCFCLWCMYKDGDGSVVDRTLTAAPLPLTHPPHPPPNNHTTPTPTPLTTTPTIPNITTNRPRRAPPPGDAPLHGRAGALAGNQEGLGQLRRRVVVDGADAGQGGREEGGWVGLVLCWWMVLSLVSSPRPVLDRRRWPPH